MRNSNHSNFTYVESQFRAASPQPPRSNINMQSNYLSGFNPEMNRAPIHHSYALPQNTKIAQPQQARFDHISPNNPYVQYPRSIDEVLQENNQQVYAIENSQLSNQKQLKYDPSVQTIKQSKWMSYYDDNKQSVPPPKLKKIKSNISCKNSILIAIGVVALLGLVAAIILGSNKGNGLDSSIKSSYSNGIPMGQTKQQSIASDTRNKNKYPKSNIKRENIYENSNTQPVVQQSKSEVSSLLSNQAGNNLSNNIGTSLVNLNRDYPLPKTIDPIIIDPIPAHLTIRKFIN